MANFFKFLTGDIPIEKVLDTVAKGADEVFYTKEEKAQAEIAAAEQAHRFRMFEQESFQKEMELQNAMMKESNADRQNARAMQEKAMVSESFFVKNFVYIFATVMILFFCFYLSVPFYREMKGEYINIYRENISLLEVVFMTILTFFFGTYHLAKHYNQPKK